MTETTLLSGFVAYGETACQALRSGSMVTGTRTAEKQSMKALGRFEPLAAVAGGLSWTRTPTLPNCRNHRNENRENIAARRSNSAPPEICLFSRKMNIQHFVNVNA